MNVSVPILPCLDLEKTVLCHDEASLSVDLNIFDDVIVSGQKYLVSLFSSRLGLC